MDAPNPDTTPRHPIRVVSRRTGLSQDILRAWERRYEAVVPTRSNTGRRLYSELDIERLVLLARLVDGGRRISEVARLSYAELASLLEEDEDAAARAPRVRSHRAQVTNGSSEAMLDHVITALENLDKEGFERALSVASVSMSAPRLRQEIIIPLLDQIGDRWREGSLRVTHEHIASAIVRRFVDGMRGRVENTGGSRLLVATPVGQRHELGALMVAAAAEESGWDVYYLGADLPAEEIAAAAIETDARAVALSLVYVGDERKTIEELTKLDDLLDPGVARMIGGRAVAPLRSTLEGAGYTCVDDISDFSTALETLPR